MRGNFSKCFFLCQHAGLSSCNFSLPEPASTNPGSEYCLLLLLPGRDGLPGPTAGMKLSCDRSCDHSCDHSCDCSCDRSSDVFSSRPQPAEMFGLLLDQWSDKVHGYENIYVAQVAQRLNSLSPSLSFSLSLSLQLDSMTNVQQRKLTGLAIASLLPLADEYVPPLQSCTLGW